MGKNVTAKPGRYRISFTPYQKEPQESFTAPDVQTTVLYWGKRLGKTEMLNNLHGAIIEQDPKNILVVYPTLDSAKKWSKQFFNPMVKSTPALRERLRETGRREASNTILAKQFPGGTISAIGANSPSGFRQVQAPVVTCDEIDAMENGSEGDPVALAFGRAENYRDNVQVISSTATRINQSLDERNKESSGSRIHDWWLKSDQRKWFVPCPKCGTFQVLRWGQVKWPEPHQHKEAYYECENEACKATWDDAARVNAICRGEWRPCAAFSGVRGYWLNGLNTTFPAKKGYKTKMHQMAAEFHDASKSGEAALIVWKNTFLCEPHEDSGERLDAAPLLERAEDYAPERLPTDCIIAVAGVDVQKDRLEIEVVGLGEDDETWGIEAGQIFGDTEQDEVWNDLGERLAKKYKREDGVELSISATAIDMRHKPKKVREFVRSCGLPRVYPVYGANSEAPLLVTTRFDKRTRIRVYAVNTKQAKDILFARLKIDEPGPRYCHFPKGNGYGEEYFQQLTAEVLKTKFLHGFPKQYYEKVRERNEALDRRVYSLAAIDILRPNLSAIAKRLRPDAPAPEAPKEYILTTPQLAVAPKPKPIKLPRMGGGFVKGWMK